MASIYNRRKGEKLWENARLMLADVPLDRDKAKKVLPLGMKLTKEPTATMFIADYTKTAFTVPYREAAMLVHVETPLGRGIHCPWMLVDDDTALIYGRELLGYPKKMASFTFEERGASLTSSVTRRGVSVMSMDMTLGEVQASPSPVFHVKTFNASGPGQLFLVNPIWLFKPKEIIRESYACRVSMTIRPSIFDPVAELIAGEAFNGRFVVLDILGGSWILPVGIAGPLWLDRVFTMRFE